MEFIEVRFKIFDRVDNKLIGTRRSMINLTCIRRISKTDNGWARIYWTTRVDPLTIDETYEAFIERVGAYMIRLEEDD